MAELLPLIRGSKVEITYCGKTVQGEVMLASSNYQSLMLRFDCGLWGPEGMYVGMMPVSWIEEKRHYKDVMQRQIVELSLPSRATETPSS